MLSNQFFFSSLSSSYSPAHHLHSVLFSATLSQQKKKTTSPSQPPLPYARASSRRQRAKTFTAAAAAVVAAVVSALPCLYPLYGSAPVSATRLGRTTNLVHQSIGAVAMKSTPSPAAPPQPSHTAIADPPPDLALPTCGYLL